MKKIILALFLSCSLLANATVRTVNNNPGGLAQFSDLQSAINASANNDTIYLHGSVNNYGSGEVADKKLTIIGPGISPDKTTSLTAMVNFIAFYNLNTLNCNGSAIVGLHINSEVRISWTGSGNSGYPVDGVKIIRNKFSNASLVLFTGNGYGSIHMYDLFVEGNYFENSGVAAASPGHFFTNITFINNVFARSAGYYGSGFIANFVNSTNVVFDHNVFYVSPTLTSDIKRLMNGPVNNVTFKNNIFNGLDNLHTNNNNATDITNCSFQNNITYNCTLNAPWTFGNNVDLTGNIANQSPELASQASVDNGVTNPLLDFSISSGPANNSGTDGKDMGVLFDQNSTMNWAFGRNSRLPYIYSMNVLNTSVPAGGILNVQLNARKAK